jgi:hypothetical protein
MDDERRGVAKGELCETGTAGANKRTLVVVERDGEALVRARVVAVPEMLGAQRVQLLDRQLVEFGHRLCIGLVGR